MVNGARFERHMHTASLQASIAWAVGNSNVTPAHFHPMIDTPEDVDLEDVEVDLPDVVPDDEKWRRFEEATGRKRPQCQEAQAT